MSGKSRIMALGKFERKLSGIHKGDSDQGP